MGERQIKVGRLKAVKAAEEQARFEADQFAAEVANKDSAGFQAAIQRQRREAEEAERAKKRSRAGVKLVVKKAGGDAGGATQECQSIPAASIPGRAEGAAPAGAQHPEAGERDVDDDEAGGLGLGGYDSEDGSSSGDSE